MLKEERHNVYTAANFAVGQSLFVWDPLEINCHTNKTTHQFDLLNLWSFVDVPLIFSCPADHVPNWQPRIVLYYNDSIELDEASGEVGVQDGAAVKARSRENSTMEC